MDFPSEDVALFGVFDGHSGTFNLIVGAEISLFAKHHFGELLKKNQSFQSGSYS